MPILIVPTNQPIRIFRAGAMLFMVNLFLGSFPGFFLFIKLFPDHVLVGPVLGIIAANSVTVWAVWALYRRAQRASAAPVGLGDFLDEMLYTLLGIMAGIPCALGVLSITVDTLKKGKFDGNDALLAGVGLLFVYFAVRGVLDLRTFWRGTPPKARDA